MRSIKKLPTCHKRKFYDAAENVVQPRICIILSIFCFAQKYNYYNIVSVVPTYIISLSTVKMFVTPQKNGARELNFFAQ